MKEFNIVHSSVILPGVIISEETYDKLFWNTMTDSFVVEILQGKYIVFFQEGKEGEAKHWAKEHGGQFIHVDELVIKPHRILYSKDEIDIITEGMAAGLRAYRDRMLLGA